MEQLAAPSPVCHAYRLGDVVEELYRQVFRPRMFAIRQMKMPVASRKRGEDKIVELTKKVQQHRIAKLFYKKGGKIEDRPRIIIFNLRKDQVQLFEPFRINVACAARQNGGKKITHPVIHIDDAADAVV